MLQSARAIPDPESAAIDAVHFGALGFLAERADLRKD
jgi:hypothetical protein